MVENLSYKPEDIERVPGQKSPEMPAEGSKEHDYAQEKIHSMASTEDRFQTIATLYDQYRKLPTEEAKEEMLKTTIKDAWRERTLNGTNSGTENWFWAKMMPAHIRAFDKKDVSPEYIRRFAESTSEMVGAVKDYRRHLGTLDDGALATELKMLTEQENALPRDKDGDIPLVLPLDSSARSPDDAASINAFQTQQLLQHKVLLAEHELKTREAAAESIFARTRRAVDKALGLSA